MNSSLCFLHTFLWVSVDRCFVFWSTFYDYCRIKQNKIEKIQIIFKQNTTINIPSMYCGQRCLKPGLGIDYFTNLTDTCGDLALFLHDHESDGDFSGGGSKMAFLERPNGHLSSCKSSRITTGCLLKSRYPVSFQLKDREKRFLTEKNALQLVALEHLQSRVAAPGEDLRLHLDSMYLVMTADTNTCNEFSKENQATQRHREAMEVMMLSYFIFFIKIAGCIFCFGAQLPGKKRAFGESVFQSRGKRFADDARIPIKHSRNEEELCAKMYG